jgi:predicted DNA-binding transcriptional regulator YafY
MRSFLKKINQLDHLIREQRTGTPANLGEKIGASERTVYDYLKLMKELGAPISYSRSRNSYFYQEHGAFNIGFIQQN